MKRWHEDYRITLREWRKHRRTHVESNKAGSGQRVGLDPQVVDCECDEQKGRFRKTDAFDCGNTRCRICHYDKFYSKDNGVKKLRADFEFREQMKEL